DALGEPIVAGSVPGGHHSHAVAQAAQAAGLRFLFTSAPLVHARRVDRLLVLGRYVVNRSTHPDVAAAVASGAVRPRLRQLAAWEMKKVAKTIGGLAYLSIRDRLLGRSDKVRWGDDLPRLPKHA